MIRAIGLVEFNSIAKGIEGADAMLKTGQVDIIVSRPICPGKYITLVWGDVAAVESAVQAGIAKAENYVVDDFILPNVHPSVIPACSGGTPVAEVQSLGIIETFSVAAMIVAADAAVIVGFVLVHYPFCGHQRLISEQIIFKLRSLQKMEPAAL